MYENTLFVVNILDYANILCENKYKILTVSSFYKG